MLQRQLPPRYAVLYEDASLSGQDGNTRGGVHPHTFVQKRAATTLAGARSIQRALERRGYHVHGVYEIINLRIRQPLEEQSGESKRLVCGKLEWEWDGERPVDK